MDRDSLSEYVLRESVFFDDPPRFKIDLSQIGSAVLTCPFIQEAILENETLGKRSRRMGICPCDFVGDVGNICLSG
jgi:hypothetical protein